jgi:Dockerin type I domain
MPVNGEILQFDGTTGNPLDPFVDENNPNAPFAPRGIVIKDGVLYVADFDGAPSPRIAKYNVETGAFIGDLVPSGFTAEFRPRGLVFGPDGKLYVSSFSFETFGSDDPAGYILRFLDTTTGTFEVVAANDGDTVHAPDEIADLHNPEGIAFGPDGRLYVSRYRIDASDNGIVVLDVTDKTQEDFIPLGEQSPQALLFGPDDRLFVSLAASGSEAGSVRAYDVVTKAFITYVLSTSSAGSLQSPWYLTFTQTNPATLAYEPWHNFVLAGDVNGSETTTALDALNIINELDRRALVNPTALLSRSRGASKFYYDVNQDGFVTGLDALRVVNSLHKDSLAGSASEQSLVAPAVLAPLVTASWVTDRLATSRTAPSGVVFAASGPLAATTEPAVVSLPSGGQTIAAESSEGSVAVVMPAQVSYEVLNREVWLLTDMALEALSHEEVARAPLAIRNAPTK